MKLLIYFLVALPISLINSSFDYTPPVEIIEKTGFAIAEDYGIDYKLIKAIAVIESGWKHNSHMARTKNNIFGLMGKSFDSVDECIHYWCKLYNKRYKGMSIDEMAKVYCPPNAAKWAEKVRRIMWKLKKKCQ